MKHESIVVVYDSCQAIAEEIADKLGAETISVQSINNRQIENMIIGFVLFHLTYKMVRLWYIY